MKEAALLIKSGSFIVYFTNRSSIFQHISQCYAKQKVTCTSVSLFVFAQHMAEIGPDRFYAPPVPPAYLKQKSFIFFSAHLLPVRKTKHALRLFSLFVFTSHVAEISPDRFYAPPVPLAYLKRKVLGFRF